VQAYFARKILTTEAMIRSQVSRPPLLKEINFAANAEDGGGGDSESDLNDDDLNQALEEESEKDN
jgi:hypothetical protein